MSDAFRRSETALTKADRRLLAHLAASREPTAASSRNLAATLKLSRRTIQASLIRLNDRGLLSTDPGSPIRSAVHRVSPVLLGGGAISHVENPGGGGGAILHTTVEKEEGVAQFCATVPGAISEPSAQVPGAILLKTLPVFHNASLLRARDTNTSLTSFKAVSVSTYPERCAKLPGEVAQFAAGLFGRNELDWQMRLRFDTLASEFLLPEGAVTHFLIDKWLEKLHARYRLHSPGALYEMLHLDLPLWIQSTAGRETIRHYREFASPPEGRKPPMMQTPSTAYRQAELR